MPLLDHFHAPLSVRRHWESFHTTWTVCLADAITPRLPEGYFVEVQTHAGASVEIDVATFEEHGNGLATANSERGATATAVAPHTKLPTPSLTMPAVFPVGFEVRVFSTSAGPTLVAALELVSPANKDRPDTRRAFATKCANYLYHGIALMVVDVVTDRRINLHNETLRLMEATDAFHVSNENSLYAVAYRPVRRGDSAEIDMWPATFEIGDRLPTLPLFLKQDHWLAIDLEETYVDACKRRRLP